jgi:endonuclease G
MAPAADFAWSDDAMRATFVLSNAVPQRQSVNAGVWAVLERAVRGLAADSDAAYVFTGPLFESASETIGPGRVAVPSHTYKVILVIEGEDKWMYAAIVPNADVAAASLGDLMTTVDEVESRTGLDFFSALPDELERQLESSAATGWSVPAARAFQSTSAMARPSRPAAPPSR